MDREDEKQNHMIVQLGFRGFLSYMGHGALQYTE